MARKGMRKIKGTFMVSMGVYPTRTKAHAEGQKNTRRGHFSKYAVIKKKGGKYRLWARVAPSQRYAGM